MPHIAQEDPASRCHMAGDCRCQENTRHALQVQSHGIGHKLKRLPFIGPCLQKQFDPGIAAGLQPGAIPGRDLVPGDDPSGKLGDLVEADAHGRSPTASRA